MPEFPQVHPDDIKKAMLEVGGEPTFLMFHAEMLPSKHELQSLEGDGLHLLYPNKSQEQSYQYSAFLESRPPSFETRAIKALVNLAQHAPSLPIHIAHVSSADAIPIIQEALNRGVNISAETCFHYLSLKAEQVPLRDTRFKAEPPIRDATNQEKLWKSLLAPEFDEKRMSYNPMPRCQASPLLQQPISMVVSDHSPCAPTDKLLPSYIPPHAEPPGYHNDVVRSANGDFFRAWGGISSLGLGLPIMWTCMPQSAQAVAVAAQGRSERRPFLTSAEKASLLQLAAWLSANPARLVGLEHQKGKLKVGFDGDVLVFDPDQYWTVEAADLKFRHKMSPYQGRVMRGRVMQTWLRGRKVYSRGEAGGEFCGEGPQGRLLLERRMAHVEGGMDGCPCVLGTQVCRGREKMMAPGGSIVAARGCDAPFSRSFLAGCFGRPGIHI